MSEWSEWRDSNPRPLVPQTSALTGLRYTPTAPFIVSAVERCNAARAPRVTSPKSAPGQGFVRRPRFRPAPRAARRDRRPQDWMGLLMPAPLWSRREARRRSPIRRAARCGRSTARQRLNALLLEELLNALDRVAFIVQQAPDEPEPLDVVGAIIASAAGPLEGPDWGKRVSQKRSTCCGKSIESATSRIVR